MTDPIKRDERSAFSLTEIVEFLCGAAQLDGVWFGERPADRPAYWWRKYLREAALTATEARIREGDLYRARAALSQEKK